MRLLEVLRAAGRDVHLSISPSGRDVIRHELKLDIDLDQLRRQPLAIQRQLARAESPAPRASSALLPPPGFHGPDGQRLVSHRRHGDLPVQRHDAQRRGRRRGRQSHSAGRRSASERAPQVDSRAPRDAACRWPTSTTCGASPKRARSCCPLRPACTTALEPSTTWWISSSRESATNSASNTPDEALGRGIISRKGAKAQRSRIADQSSFCLCALRAFA